MSSALAVDDRAIHSQPSPGTPLRRLDLPRLLLVLIAISGCGLRLLGVSWGLPLGLHPDEDVVVEGAVDMARRNSFEPSFFARPDHMEMKLSYLAFSVYSRIFRGSSVEAVFDTDPAALLAISRLITVAFGVGMIVLAFAIGKRFSTWTGVVAAFLFAFFPVYVEHSHFATPDVPLTFMLMVVIFGCVRYLDSNSWTHLLLASAGVAAAIAVKYPGAISYAAIVASVAVNAVRFRSPMSLISRGVGTSVAVVGFLFLISPNLFTNAPAVVEQLSAQSGGSHPGADGLGLLGNLSFYARVYVSAAGVLALGAAAIGLYWSIRSRSLRTTPLLVGGLFWVALSVLPLHWERWGLPMFVTPLLLAAIGIVETLKSPAIRQQRALTALTCAIVTVIGLNFLVGAVAVAASYRAADTRLVAREDLTAMGINEANSLAEGYGPFGEAQLRTVFRAFTGDDPPTLKKRNRDDIDYLVLSSGIFERFLLEDKYRQKQEFYSQVVETYPLVYSIDPVAPHRRTPWELLNVARAVSFITRVSDGPVGPKIRVFDLSSATDPQAGSLSLGRL